MEKNEEQGKNRSTRFAKGHVKTGGRKKGTPNRAKCMAQRLLEEYVRGNREKVFADINSLNSKDRGKLIMALTRAKLLVYVLTGKEAVNQWRKSKRQSGREGGVKNDV